MKSPAGQMPLTPEPRPNCTRALVVWKATDGITKQLCFCPDCIRNREEAFDLVRPPKFPNRGAE